MILLWQFIKISGWKNWPIINQWIILLSVLFIVLIGIVTGALNIIYRRNISSYARQQMASLVYVADSVGAYFEGLTLFTLDLYANSEVLYKLFNNYSSLQQNTIIVNRTETFFDSRPDLSGLTFYFSKTQSMLQILRHRTREATFIKVDDIAERVPWIDKISLAERRFLSPAYSASADNPGHLTYNHLISDWRGENMLSILSLKIDPSYLGQRVKALAFGPDDLVMVLSNGNKLMHYEGGVETRQAALEVALRLPDKLGNEYFIENIAGNEYLVVYTKDRKNDLLIFHAISLADISAIILPGGLVLAIIGIGLFIFTLIIVMLLSRHIILPVRTLITEMERIGQGQFGVKLGLGVTSYEIKKLTSGFNLVSDEMSRMQNEQLKSQLAQKSAELHALQTQIHPHFLYNTLQTIQYMALKRKAYEIHAMVQALADIMEYALRGGHHMVPLGKELSYVNKYLVIQKYKYMDKFFFETDISEDLSKIAVPKMFLQTLTENSFVHGFTKECENFRISVRCLRQNGYCAIEVIDNGRGINSKLIDKLNYLVENGDSDFDADHVGLANVAARLKRMYQGKARMMLESKPFVCTKVTIHIPVEEAKLSEAYNS
jgi:two-component system sensor histidine kinase YesM